jgi:hypothetical protein
MHPYLLFANEIGMIICNRQVKRWFHRAY